MSDPIDKQYQACLDYIFLKLPMFTRVGQAAYKPNLDNIEALLTAIQNPHQQFKAIHIAGTNGKGSCSHMLASVLQCAGYKTGLYTSPHIHDFRERIKINGQDIPKDKVVAFIEKSKDDIESIQPSFFEISVAMAFEYFAQEKVDIAVVEVGLGGLLDSTNVITPEVSVITNISMDHTNLLGNTLEDIARQKAGIIKQGIPVVIGETDPQTEKIFVTKSIVSHSQIFFADKMYEVVHTEIEQKKLKLKVVDLGRTTITEYYLDLLGLYQSKNLKTVLCTLEVLKNANWKIPESALRKGLQQVKLMTHLKGRFDLLQHKPDVVLDVSHNEAGVQELLKQMDAWTYRKLHIVLSFVQDKDIHRILTMLPKHAQYYFTQANIPRALHHEELKSHANEEGLDGMSFQNMTQALTHVMKDIHPDDMLLVSGSFFTLDEAYSFFENRKEQDSI